MKMIISNADFEPAIKAMDAAADVGRGQSPGVKTALERIGLEEGEAQAAEFDDRAAGGTTRGVKWKPLSFITGIFRRRGKGFRKVETIDELIQMTGGLLILKDTNIGRMSITGRGPDGVLRVTGLSVEVGTANKNMQRHHDGDPSNKMDIPRGERAIEDKLSKTVRKTRPGRKPRKTDRGKPSRASRNWNPAFFILRNYLLKRAGGSAPLPARLVITEPPQERIDDYASDIVEAI